MYYGVTTIMIKYPIPLIILLVIPFFIIPSSAEDNLFINPGFETGSFTNWTVYVTGGGSGAAAVGTGYKYTGVYGARLYGKSYNGGIVGNAYIYQNIDLTDIETIEFYLRVLQSDHASRFHIMIDLSNYIYTDQTIGAYKKVSVNVSTFTGYHDVRFNARAISSIGQGWCYAEMYVDDVITLEVSDGENTINYNPDIPISNTKPFNLSYTLNNTYVDNPLYPCFIYSWVGTDIGNETHPNIIWQYNYEGYVNQASGSFTTSDYFHSYNWPDLNVSYGIVLYNPDGMTEGIRFDNIESDTNMLDYDQIYVNYSYNKTPPSPPLPQPTPNMTAIPTPSGTPTPQPTATPQPNPESINESLNTSFKQGYSNLVNTTIDGFYEPVYNFTYYVASPLLGINDTLYNFSIHMNESFTTSNNSLILSSSILFMIMVNIPDKLINVMTYYLVWLIILLIFKGDA
jgi:hypothetical protein